MNYNFDQAKQAVADRHKHQSFEWLLHEANWDKIDDVYREVAEIYADQFIIKKPNQEVLTQDDFNLFEAGYLALLEFYNNHSQPDPTEADLEIAAIEWFDYNRGSYVPYIWRSAIEWYKNKKAELANGSLLS